MQHKLPLERRHHGERNTATTSTETLPGVRGAEFRSLVARVLQERERSLRNGWCRMNPAAMRMRMAPVQQWLNEHPAFVSDAAVVKFWLRHNADMALIAPATNAGRAMFNRLLNIAFQC